MSPSGTFLGMDMASAGMMPSASGMPMGMGHGMLDPMMAQGMNPMMGMMNPMMGMMNPMMAMMQSMMAGMMSGGMCSGTSGMQTAQSSPCTTASSAGSDELPVDPQVRKLCKEFDIEDRLMRKLDAVMRKRPESFDEDIQTLRDRLGEPRADIGVLITQLDKGLFVSLGCMPKEMIALVKKYGLDDRASQRLAESMQKRKETMKEDLEDLDIRLASADRPSGLLMTLLQGLDSTGRLPAPPKSLGLPTTHRERAAHHQPADDRDRERGRRDRSRSRGRRSRSRRR